jgi:hypothetical protein
LALKSVQLIKIKGLLIIIVLKYSSKVLFDKNVGWWLLVTGSWHCTALALLLTTELVFAFSVFDTYEKTENAKLYYLTSVIT